MVAPRGTGARPSRRLTSGQQPILYSTGSFFYILLILVGAFVVAKQRPKRIMVVDDDEAVVEVIDVGLRKKGYRVGAFSDPSVALAAFVPRSYDVAVLDVRMGPFDGLELYRRLKGLDPHLDVLFLTAYADVVKEKPDGIRFLQKPVTLVDLVRALEDR